MGLKIGIITISLMLITHGSFRNNLALGEPIKIRVMTWNVDMNREMNGGFTDKAIIKVFGLNNMTTIPSVYALGLQENCWMCNKRDWSKLGERFLMILNSKASESYEIVGIQGTSESDLCRWSCRLMHGSSIIIVFAKRSLGTTHLMFHHNTGCSSKIIPNSEQGVSALKYDLGKTGKSLCFASVHLDPLDSGYRRQCLKQFFGLANQETSWSATCDFQFIFGDFNAQTEKKTQSYQYGLTKKRYEDLREKDELNGKKPFGIDNEWNKNLLAFINFIQPKKFQEDAVDFLPTFSLRPAKQYCQGKRPCYNRHHPMSWKDRILFTRGKCEDYHAIYEEYGDHYPVFAEFIINV